MKKIVMTVVAAAFVASLASAQTVTSANIVGYTKVSVVGGELSLVAVNFETGGATVAQLCASLPSGSAVYVWDKASNAYASASRGSRGWSGGDRVVELGDGMWIAPSGTATYELIFAGEVSMQDSVVTLPSGVVATGFYFPVETEVRDTAIAANLPSGSAIFVWDAASQQYTSASRGSRGWSGSAIAGPADAFWVSNSGDAQDVTVSVPFTP